MFPESNPTAIFKACVNINVNCTKHLPKQGMEYVAYIFKEKSWKNAINKVDYYKQHNFTQEIPEDLAGGISCHGLMPLQSKKYSSEIQRHINGKREHRRFYQRSYQQSEAKK